MTWGNEQNLGVNSPESFDLIFLSLVTLVSN
jgi:hypothetical protein